MKIEVLYFDDCPNYGPTLELVRQVVSDLNVDAEITSVEIKGADDAQRLRFLGSPSVHIDGRDADPDARGRMQYNFGCRRYGQSGCPPRLMLEQVIQAGVRS